MTPTVVLPVIIGGLYAAGVYLLLDRSLTRVLLGFLLLGNATNLLVLSSGGPAGGPPIIGVTEPGEMSDPLTQALVLTAIVITFGIAAFLLAMIYRSWRLVRQEVVGVDEEDRRVARREGIHADELDPDDLAPEDRSAAHADSLHSSSLEGDRAAEHALAERYAGIPSDDVDLPPTRGAAR
ncbi:Na(+)/H(+) antiporter subunit C [Geodermatophilus sp. DF01-2]|uniref:Na(+)/H(+) antiporter subunit C n=1 Tax=Geodermatophilus sp. DF01-2 TaxID=2559610 RepID=UPI0010746A11|nr:Na(+)/H(+) antiporter subunit C [Geodermatophilus sp. DF01_2]TFV60805.1 Na(+)/H(+) antiporter subunit C [Geodermatophilus sp. DF01_2]